MLGRHGGVQAKMKGAGYRNATYVHCASRRLNRDLRYIRPYYHFKPWITQRLNIIPEIAYISTGNTTRGGARDGARWG